MKKLPLILALLCNVCYAQQMLHDVITHYSNIRQKNKIVKVTLPQNSTDVFYRITTFNPEKVNTYDGFHDAVQAVTPDELRASSYDFSKHELPNNTALTIDAAFFDDAKSAETFAEQKSATGFYKVDSFNKTTGKFGAPKATEIYVGIRPIRRGQPITVKIEVLALAPAKFNSTVDIHPYSIQNETDSTVVYEISGSRSDWDVFHLPKCKKADFKLADTRVYFRVSTLVKTSEEYIIESNKKYRLFWNKDKTRVDLSEIEGKK